MEWNVVTVNETGGKTVPFVSIGRGTLDFSQAACELINDDGGYKFAQLLTGKENGKAVVAVKFLTEYEENCIPIKRKVLKGKTVSGMTVRNKEAIEKLFGKDGSNKGMVRHKVEPIGNNMLKIID
jgi:hypothetical protein